MKISPVASFYEQNYWRAGFQTRLYDFLTVEAYLESLRKAVACVPEKEGQVWLDAGCGTGRAMEFLGTGGRREIRYLGTDVLEAGLRRLRRRAEEGGSNQRVLGFRGDLTLGLPLPENSVDVVLAHFSLYTLPGEGERRKALRLLGEVLRPSGRLVLVNPSKTYDPRAIVRESLQLLHHRKGWFSAGWHRCFVYPFSLHLGLKFVARQLRSGRWKAYELDELCREVEEAGFRIQHRETVYGGGAFLVTAGPEKPAGDLSGPITRVALPAASE